MSKEQDSIKTLQEEYPDINDAVAAMQERAIQTVSERIKKEQFDRNLKERFPTWEATWYSSEFQKFLQETHEYSGLPNHLLLKDAFDRLDSARVIKIFDSFFRRRSSLQSASRTQPSMSVEEAKAALMKLSRTRASGKFKGTEIEFRKKEALLRKIILGG